MSTTVDLPLVEMIPAAIVCEGDWISTTAHQTPVLVLGNVRVVRSGRRKSWVASVLTDDGPDDRILSARVGLHRLP